MKALRVIQFNDNEIRRNFIENLPYNPKLKTVARELRKSRNLADVLFWNQVKSGKFHHLDFDRQKIIGNYIVDFYVKSLGLVVEIDGFFHEFKRENDALRQNYIENFGVKFFKVSDFDVKKNMLWVLTELENFILENYKIL